MSQLVLARGRKNLRGVCRRTVSSEVMISPLSMVFVLLVFVVFASLVHLMNSNQALVKGYEIKQLDDRRRELLDINEKRQNHLSEVTSIVRMKQSEVAGRMVKPRSVTYVKGDTSIAMSE